MNLETFGDAILALAGLHPPDGEPAHLLQRPMVERSGISSGLQVHAYDTRNLDPKFRRYEYISLNPHNESEFFFPCDGSFQDPDDDELLDALATHVVVRGHSIPLPPPAAYAATAIPLEDPSRVRVFELCRYLAATHRDLVLATPSERTVHISPGLQQLLVLDEWHHPDLLAGERPSTSATFQQLATALSVGDAAAYQPVAQPNTHWRFWPDGGSL